MAIISKYPIANNVGIIRFSIVNKLIDLESIILTAKKQRYIYVLRCGNELKIGYSVDPAARLKVIQTSRAQEVILEWSRERSDATKLEKHLHRTFQRYKLGGEWFDGTQLAVEEIKRACFGFIQYDWD